MGEVEVVLLVGGVVVVLLIVGGVVVLLLVGVVVCTTVSGGDAKQRHGDQRRKFASTQRCLHQDSQNTINEIQKYKSRKTWQSE